MDIPGFTAGVSNEVRNNRCEHYSNYRLHQTNTARTELIPQQYAYCSLCEELSAGRHCFNIDGERKCEDIPFDGTWKLCCEWGFPNEYCYLQDCL
jgi:hypothetical protein